MPIGLFGDADERSFCEADEVKTTLHWNVLGVNGMEGK
jgi:hypothetical protein